MIQVVLWYFAERFIPLLVRCLCHCSFLCFPLSFRPCGILCICGGAVRSCSGRFDPLLLLAASQPATCFFLGFHLFLLRPVDLHQIPYGSGIKSAAHASSGLAFVSMHSSHAPLRRFFPCLCLLACPSILF